MCVSGWTCDPGPLGTAAASDGAPRGGHALKPVVEEVVCQAHRSMTREKREEQEENTVAQKPKEKQKCFRQETQHLW